MKEVKFFTMREMSSEGMVALWIDRWKNITITDQDILKSLNDSRPFGDSVQFINVVAKPFSDIGEVSSLGGANMDALRIILDKRKVRFMTDFEEPFTLGYPKW